jgi:hypothetical protein
MQDAALPPLSPPCGERPSEEVGTALVVFVDECGLKYLRRLRRGFRHCFVAVRTDAGWVICDPLSHRTDLNVVGGLSAAELTHWYRSHGLRVVATRVRPAPLRPAPVRPYTCVEAVKRVLGIHAPWILTPWQLYRRLGGTGDENVLTDDAP